MTVHRAPANVPEPPRATLVASVAARVGPLRLEVALDTAEGPLVIVGPNGAGKSSLLAALLGLLPETRGRVTVGGRVLLDTDAGVDVPVEQRRLAYVPQDFALFPHLDVRATVDFALRCAPERLSRSRRDERVAQLLVQFGLEEFGARRVQTLSGGERQRVALARALAGSPEALLLDEPLSALDVHARREVRGVLTSRLAQLDLPTLVVTHDAADAQALGGHVLVLEAGHVSQRGTWEELRAAPATPFVAELVGASGAYATSD